MAIGTDITNNIDFEIKAPLPLTLTMTLTRVLCTDVVISKLITLTSHGIASLCVHNNSPTCTFGQVTLQNRVLLIYLSRPVLNSSDQFKRYLTIYGVFTVVYDVGFDVIDFN